MGDELARHGDGTGRLVVPAARTVEPPPRPQWQGLFREPDWPPEGEPTAE